MSQPGKNDIQESARNTAAINKTSRSEDQRTCEESGELRTKLATRLYPGVFRSSNAFFQDWKAGS